MPDPETDQPPWQQRLLDREWLLAIVAILFFALSYVVWGVLDLLAITGG